MGTALTNEEKIQQLKELVEEYVKHLNLWDKVSVEQVMRTEANIPKMVKVKDNYGFESEVQSYDRVPIAPSPYIIVKYYSPTKEWSNKLHPSGFESREFPMCDIGKRITHYRNKLKYIKEKTL